jgi:predicted small secreted protein
MKMLSTFSLAGVAIVLAGCANMHGFGRVQPLNCTVENCQSLSIAVADNCSFGDKSTIPEIVLSGGHGKRTLTWTLASGSPYVFAPERIFFKGPIYFAGDVRGGDPRDRFTPGDVKVKDQGKTLEVRLDRQRGEIEISPPIRIKYFLNLVHETKKYKDRNGNPTQPEWCEIDPWIVDR